MLHRDVLMTYVADAVGMEMEELRTLNPQYRADFIPASSQPYSLCLPMAKMESFLMAQDSIYARTADSLERRPIAVEPVKAKSSKGKGTKNRGRFCVSQNCETQNRPLSFFVIARISL